MGVRHTQQDNLPGGVIAVNKPVGISSHDVVNRIRRLYNTKRVGHAGTLDPLAEGVLVVLVGRAAKACEYISSDKKTYTATLRLGIETDTEDITGEVTKGYEGELPDAEAVARACRALTGKIMQTPPMYSALKVGGQKLYDLARRGVVVERQAREVEVYSLECQPTSSPDRYTLTVSCSGGTYIRTLCADIGRMLGCGGVMETLRRDEACGIKLSQTYTLEALDMMDDSQREGALIDTEVLFEDLQAIKLVRFYEKLFRDGCPIYQSKIRVHIPVGERVRVCDEAGEFFALGEGEERDGEAVVRSIKIFRL